MTAPYGGAARRNDRPGVATLFAVAQRIPAWSTRDPHERSSALEKTVQAMTERIRGRGWLRQARWMFLPPSSWMTGDPRYDEATIIAKGPAVGGDR